MRALYAVFAGCALAGVSLSALFFSFSSTPTAGYAFLASAAGIGAIISFTLASFWSDNE